MPREPPLGERSTRLSRAGRASPAVPWLPSSSTVPTHNHCGLVVSKSSGWGGGRCFQGKAGAGGVSPCPCHPCMGTGAGLSWGHATACPSPCTRCPQCPAVAPRGQGTHQLLGAGGSPEQRDKKGGQHWGTGSITGKLKGRRTCAQCDCACPTSPGAAAVMGTAHPAPVTALPGN